VVGGDGLGRDGWGMDGGTAGGGVGLILLVPLLHIHPIKTTNQNSKKFQ